ncbi:hypothetical protein RO865_12410 [Blautia faecis]|nr:hypothetical protein [Blautia faecis]MDT4369612.1 hypothetical protein [Blautia faecis]MED9823785.1 hypothetical protein [Blautia faecis]
MQIAGMIFETRSSCNIL